MSNTSVKDQLQFANAMNMSETSILLALKKLLNLIGKDLSREISQDKIANTLTPMQSLVMVIVHEAEENYEPIYQRDLENRFNIRGSTVTGVLQLMEKRQLLTRRAVSQDARLKQIVLTDKAKTILARTNNKLVLVEQKMNAVLTDKERRTLWTIINKLSSQFPADERKKTKNEKKSTN